MTTNRTDRVLSVCYCSVVLYRRRFTLSVFVSALLWLRVLLTETFSYGSVSSCCACRGLPYSTNEQTDSYEHQTLNHPFSTRAPSMTFDDADRGVGNPLANAFGPDMMAKLAAEPKFVPYLADPSFVAKLHSLQQNPNNMQANLSDPRIMEVRRCWSFVVTACVVTPREIAPR